MSPGARMRAYLELSRASNAPTAVSNALAGTALAAVAHGAPTLPGFWRAAALSSTAIVAFYVAGMALNDLFDRVIDARERPHRPIPSGRVSPEGAAAFASVLIVGGLLLLALNDLVQLASGVVLVALIVLYDLLHARSRFTVLIMGACRAMAIITASLAFGLPESPMPAVGPAILLLVYVAGFSLVARREAMFSAAEPAQVCGHCDYPVPNERCRCPECGRDLDPARRGDIVPPGSRPRRHRFRFAPYVGVIPVLAFVFIPLSVLQRVSHDPLEIALLIGTVVMPAIFLAWTTGAARLIERIPPAVGPAVTMWIAAISLSDAYLALLARSMPMAIVCIACFLLTRAAQRRIAGT